jgi:hydroxyethylthiazole kinase-like uncharacterized protein yjeF
MTNLLTAEQMRAAERAAMDSGTVTGLELMERAGAGVVEVVLDEWPELAEGPRRAVVLCGPGNNGGDGFVIARLLGQRGWDVSAWLYGDAERLPPDAKTNHDAWAALGAVQSLAFPDMTARDASDLSAALCAEPDLVVDALFGTGLTRPAAGLGPIFEMSEELIGRTPTRWVAVDVPSGLCADSGRLFETPDSAAPHPVVQAHLTVTFHTPKTGHVLDRAPEWCGALRVVDIGLADNGSPGASIRSCGEQARLAKVFAPSLRKVSGRHKYEYGHALILSGGAGHTGAARLAARGALRIGAGLVTLGVPGSAKMECAAQVTAVMLRRVDDGKALAALLADARFNALCLGPGLGVERARHLVTAALCAGHRPRLVLDADALTAFADAPDDLFAMLHENCVLTPHGGEFARLFPDIAERLNAPAMKGPAFSRLDATREAATQAGCTVLFKGPDTVIAAPDGSAVVNAAVYDRAAPWLATAGSGDVLAGFITGLLARGLSPLQAAETAAWLHTECARRFGPGLIAEDLPETLPAVLRDLVP